MTSTPRSARRAGRIAAPAGAVLTAVLSAALVGSLAVAGAAAPASAATTRSSALHGRISSARQDTDNRKLSVSGFAYDGSRRASSVRVSLFVNGHYKRSTVARESSRRYDRRAHVTGRHAFSVTFRMPHRARVVRLQVHAAGAPAHKASVDRAHVRQYSPAAKRIVRIARRYVGSRYSYGADGPRAFDCSGYSMFVYGKAHVAHLPHNSQAQRHARHMHRETRAHARPGDLVFYLSGNSAYHVSIYAGHGKQYSATDPQRGVEHSKISSRHVVFKTDWH